VIRQQIHCLPPGQASRVELTGTKLSNSYATLPCGSITGILLTTLNDCGPEVSFCCSEVAEVEERTADLRL
jgi:hypothetical protein